MSCAGCTKEFNRPDKLKAHIIAHAGAKPYRCQTCGRTFTRRPHLREHERFHAENYRFWCDRCHQGFMRQNLLKQHNCTGTASSATSQHSFRRKVGRPRKNMQLHTDSSTPVTEQVGCACNFIKMCFNCNLIILVIVIVLTINTWPLCTTSHVYFMRLFGPLIFVCGMEE